MTSFCETKIGNYYVFQAEIRNPNTLGIRILVKIRADMAYLSRPWGGKRNPLLTFSYEELMMFLSKTKTDWT